MVSPAAWRGCAARLGADRSLAGLTVEQAAALAGPGDVIVEVAAAAVNRSDVLNALGAFPQVCDGRIPGRDFAGTVVDGPAELVGTEVWGTGGGELGLTRDGSHARYLSIPVEAAVARPAGLSAVEAGAAGLAYLTAAAALAEVSPIGPGTVVLVTGAAGGVGGAVIGVAKARGAHVIGLVRGAASAAAASAQGADEVIDPGTGTLPSGGVEVVVDTVGPPLLDAVLPLLVTGGRLCLMTAPQGGILQLDVLNFYRRALRVVGLNTMRFDAAQAATVLREVCPAIERGELRAPRVARTFPLAEVEQAYATVHAGGTRGRVVLVPGEG
ncbi:zinc-binding alcohol dehydrogenase family protein [Nocardia sp. NPDC005745]|uniref:zinc-binding alcohol dehydrogenase family protein n=1 Tax=Nocardia sp. NPDC005745 TaxID=3157061 RepID=UPI0033F525C3